MDVEQLARDLSREFRVRLEPDDPILMAALLNQRLLEQSLVAVEGVAKVAADRISAAAGQQAEAAQRQAETLISEAAEWICNRLKETGEAVTAAQLVQLRRETDRAEKASRAAIRAAWTTGLFCALTFSGMLGIGLSLLH